MRRAIAVFLALSLVTCLAHAQGNPDADLGSLIDALKRSQGNNALDIGEFKRMIGELNRMNATAGNLNQSRLGGYLEGNESITVGEGEVDLAQIMFIAEAGKQIQNKMSGKNPADKRYYEPNEQLSVMFDQMTRNLDPEIMQRMVAGKDDALASRIISSLAGREKARLRNEDMMKFMMAPDSSLDTEVSNMLFPQALNSSNQTFEDDRVIRELFDGMDPAFKRKITYIAVNGSLDDRGALKDIVSGYSSAENRALGAELFEKIGKNSLENDRIRNVLRENGGIDEMLNVLR
jgi:hypothetical protein